MYSIVTTDPLVSPATAQELIDWARLDSDDPKIAPSLLTATRLAISFLKLELLPRTYTLKYEDWPIMGTVGGSRLSRCTYSSKLRIDIPYANTISITSVTVNGVVLAATDYKIIKGKPDKIQFETVGYNDTENTALEIIYSAGYGATAVNIPRPIIQAIVICAGYIHAHSGGCDTGNAIQQSGAAELFRPYAVMGGLVF